MTRLFHPVVGCVVRNLSALLLGRCPVLLLALSSDFILNSLPIALSLSLLLEIDLLRLILKSHGMLILLLPEWLSVSLLVVHSVEPGVEAAILLAQHELFLAYGVREVAVATFAAISVPITFLAARRACIRHRDVRGARPRLPGW